MISSATHTTSRIILATPRALFRTLLDPETIPAWRPPKGMTLRIEHFDPRPGGAYRMVFQYPRDDSAPGKSTPDAEIVEGEFVEIHPDEQIIQAVRCETEDPRVKGAMIITTTLEPVRDGTKVILTAEGVPPAIGEAEHRAGMDATLKNLANFVE